MADDHRPAMTPERFIEIWGRSELKERSAAQSHFNDLCDLLGEPRPHEADPKGEFYCFERGAAKEGGGEGWADVWKRHHFGWEYKGKKKDLEKAQDQLRQYAVALENPPLLVVCDTDRFIITTNFTNTVQERHELALEDLRDAGKRALLKAVFSHPERLKPGKTRQALTEEAAGEFAALAKRLRERGHDPERVAHFVNRLVFCMFAEDVDLLPKKMFQRMLEQSEHAPEEFEENARTLFAAMHAKEAKHRRVGFESVHWFNGGLFDSDDVLPLEKADVKNLLAAAKLDWSEIDPSILGTLFERGLDPDKRSQLGAHYTDRDKIMMIIDPVIKEPLEAEWTAAKAEIEAELAKAKSAKNAGAKTAAKNRAAKAHSAFMEKLAKFRVLDPACGSGNFLYLALLTLKDIEHRANLEAEALGLPRGFPRVGPECVMGIEINPYAAELARVSVWIGEIQWMRKNGFSANTNPVLRPLDTIENADALVVEHLDREDWTEKAWPEADVIVGNPPFLGGKLLRSYLGDNYVDRLFGLYRDRVRPEADLVTYWIAKGGAAIGAMRAARVGFVTTNSIRGGANREVVKEALKTSRLFFAWDDEPWVVDGAAVRVSMVGLEPADGKNPAMLDGEAVETILSDLTPSSPDRIDLTNAVRMDANKGFAFQGPVKVGQFNIDGEHARGLLKAPTNPNGLTNEAVLRPWSNGMDIVRRPSGQWIIEFGDMEEGDAALFELPFEYVRQEIRPVRIENRDWQRRTYWWRLGRSGGALKRASEGLERLIVTPRVSKYRLFTWAPRRTLPDSAVVAIARDDDTTFGILHSRFHELWSLRMGTWLGKGNDPRYTPTTTFETFPFPEGLTPDIPAGDYADDPRAQKIAAAAARLNELRENWLNPPDLVRREPEVVAGYPDRILPVDEAAASELKKRTLTNLYNQRPAWLDHAHRALDEAVAEAYGWPADLSDDEVLAKLFALNQARAGT
ncbi:MAG: class I SAM-dependent DNA methyltransferase [Oceanicaulis sp.]